MLEILKRSRFFFVGERGGGGRGGLYVLPKNVVVFVLQNYMIYLLHLFSPPLSFAILYVLKKIAFAIIFCFTCVCLHAAVISLLYIGRIDGFVYVQLLNIVVLQPLFIRKLKTCFKFLLDNIFLENVC